MLAMVNAMGIPSLHVKIQKKSLLGRLIPSGPGRSGPKTALMPGLASEPFLDQTLWLYVIHEYPCIISGRGASQ